MAATIPASMLKTFPITSRSSFPLPMRINRAIPIIRSTVRAMIVLRNPDIPVDPVAPLSSLLYSTIASIAIRIAGNKIIAATYHPTDTGGAACTASCAACTTCDSLDIIKSYLLSSLFIAPIFFKGTRKYGAYT